MFNVKAHYLQHDGGTKFYETVLIDEPNGPAMLIKRWGKINEMNGGGGQTKIERGSLSALRLERDKILVEKRKLRNGGRYIDASSAYMLHSVRGPVDEDKLKGWLKHYKDPTVQNAVMEYFRFTNDVEDIVAATGEDVVVESEPEIERDASWGSW